MQRDFNLNSVSTAGFLQFPVVAPGPQDNSARWPVIHKLSMTRVTVTISGLSLFPEGMTGCLWDTKCPCTAVSVNHFRAMGSLEGPA